MKTTGLSSAALLTLLGLSAAHPQGTRDAQGAVVEPGKIVVTETSLTEPTEFAQVVVYVDEGSTPLETATETVRFIPKRVSKPADLDTRSGGVSSRATSSQSNSVSPSSDTSASVSPSSDTSTSVSPSSDTSTSASPSSSSSAGLYGVAYAPYTAQSQCKTPEQIGADFAMLRGKYSVVRIYGTDCNQVANTLAAAIEAGIKLILGIFDLDAMEPQVQTIISAVDGDWSRIDTVSVGNELVNSGKATAQQVITAIGQARKLLRAAGYKGPVVTVDTFVAVLANPSLCDMSDYCAVNIHPFFDGKTAAGDAGSFVTNMVSQVQAKLSDRSKRIVCTETGWPWQGNSNGAAVPGINEQKQAINSIKKAYASHPSDVILFSAFNDVWKPSEANTFHAEQYWGIGGLYSDSDK